MLMFVKTVEGLHFATVKPFSQFLVLLQHFSRLSLMALVGANSFAAFRILGSF